jgi:UTP--glucose-1-phosphate uridylyltransferase
MAPAISIRKAVIPAAGLGTRMFSVSKVVPKELLPVGGKPLIQRAIEEAVASGVEEVVVVIRPGKSLLESFLSADQKWMPSRSHQGEEADPLAPDAFSSPVRITLVQQAQPRGLGDALLCARPAVGNEMFGLVLPDAVIDAPRPALAQLTAAFREQPGAYVATQSVEPSDVSRFGMLVLDSTADAARTGEVFRVRSIVEKPEPGQSPSNFGVFGRYVLTPEIFAELDRLTETSDGEVQLSEALASYCQRHPLYAFRFKGSHYDAGDPLGYFQAVVEFALKDTDMGPMFRDYLAGIVERAPKQRSA